MEILYLVTRIASNLAPVPLLIVGWRYRRLLWWYALAAILADAGALVLKGFHLPANPLANLFLLVELGVFSLFYSRSLSLPWPVRGAMFIVAFLFAAHTVHQGIENVNLLGAAVLYLIYLSYALLGYHRMLSTTSVTLPTQSEKFWVHTALIFYSSGTCFLFLYYKSMLAEDNDGIQFWITLFFVANITKYLLLAFAERARQRH